MPSAIVDALALPAEAEATTLIAQAERRYRARNPKSAALFDQACRHLPGGSTRATAFFPPFPLSIRRGEGQWLIDADEHRYVDLLGDYTAGVYGHDGAMLEKVFDAIRETGVSLCGPTSYEARLAKLICERFPSCDLVRFCNSGTEANLYATALAKQFTGRKTVLLFRGAYHGGVLTFGDHDGPLNIEFPYVKAEYNDRAGTRQLIEEHRTDLAAVLVEPMFGSGGCIPADPQFLSMLRHECRRHSILLIFDEVMNSRLGPSGMQGILGIEPDLTTFGKYLGGGFSFGAFGGRKDVMSLLDLRRPDGLPHPGTFNNNVASMAAGCIGLGEYYTAQAAVETNARGERLRGFLNDAARRADVPVVVTGRGAVMNLHFAPGAVSNPSDLRDEATTPLKRLLHFHLLEDGLYIAPRGLITVSMAVSESSVLKLCASASTFFTAHKKLITEIVAHAQ